MTRTTVVFAVGLLLSIALVAQESAQPFDTAEPEQDFSSRSDLDEIDRLLEEDEEVLAGTGYNYDSEGRRDPFRSLLVVSERPEISGPRPEGIPGLLIDEVDVTGVYVTESGPIAQVQAANKEKSFLLRIGDQLYDGDVVNITRQEVVFKQIVHDPTAPKPFREVTKKLNP